METLALHFPFNFCAPCFPVISSALACSPECGLCVIISITREEEEGAESIPFSSSKTKQDHPKAALRQGQRGNRSVPTVGPSFFSMPAGSARSHTGRRKRTGNGAAPRGCCRAGSPYRRHPTNSAFRPCAEPFPTAPGTCSQSARG